MANTNNLSAEELAKLRGMAGNADAGALSSAYLAAANQRAPATTLPSAGATGPATLETRIGGGATTPVQPGPAASVNGGGYTYPVQQKTYDKTYQTEYQKALDYYTGGLKSSTPEEQSFWKDLQGRAANGDSSWARALNDYTTAGNWNGYTENGVPTGFLKAQTGRVIGNYLPVLGGDLSQAGLPGTPEEYHFTDAQGNIYTPDANWQLRQTGTAAEAAAARAANLAQEAARKMDGGLHGTFRSSNGNVYDYDTATDEELARHGYHRDALGIVRTGRGPAGQVDALIARAQAGAARSPGGTGEANSSTGGSSGGSASYGAPGTEWQRYLDEFSYGRAPEWEGTDYERRRDEALGRAESMEWNYDPDTDPVWQAYQKQYRREGNRATEDVLGRAAAMTNGIPSSYAVSAAAQAGNNYAAQLSDRLPELYNDAYNRYLQEFQRQLGIADAYAGYGQTEYNRYLDRLGQWNTDRNFGYNAYRDSVADQRYDQEWAQQMREYADSQNWKATEWEQYLREYGDQLSQQEREWAYQQARDAESDRRYADETAYERSRDAVGDERWERQYNDSLYEDALSFYQKYGYIPERYADVLGADAAALPAAGQTGGYTGGGSSGGSGNGAGSGSIGEPNWAKVSAGKLAGELAGWYGGRVLTDQQWYEAIGKDSRISDAWLQKNGFRRQQDIINSESTGAPMAVNDFYKAMLEEQGRWGGENGNGSAAGVDQIGNRHSGDWVAIDSTDYGTGGNYNRVSLQELYTLVENGDVKETYRDGKYWYTWTPKGNGGR